MNQLEVLTWGEQTTGCAVGLLRSIGTLIHKKSPIILMAAVDNAFISLLQTDVCCILLHRCSVIRVTLKSMLEKIPSKLASSPWCRVNGKRTLWVFVEMFLVDVVRHLDKYIAACCWFVKPVGRDPCFLFRLEAELWRSHSCVSLHSSGHFFLIFLICISRWLIF